MSGESDRQFVDTNILVYSHDTSAGAKHRVARALVEQLWASGAGCLSVQVLQEFYVAITQKVARPIAPVTARQIVKSLSNWTMHTPGTDDVLAAIDIHSRLGVSFWDALIIQSASRLGCGRIVTEDLNPGQIYQGIRAVSPF
jgi:predicted nucleic acid-binding protein